MTDICDIFDQLRADIAQAHRWRCQADDMVANQILDEAYSDGTSNPGAHELQRQAEEHLEQLQREFALLELMLEGWRPDDDSPRLEGL
jgi:predicted ribosome quality control (RQC) complex YloA/Tae2 family protein